MSLIDTCVNLLSGQFRKDREEILTRAHDAGVTGFLFTATDIESSSALQAHCGTNRLTTAGVHPHDASGVCDDWIDQLTELVSADCVRAVGETGLDFNRNFSPPDVQREVFRYQVELAQRVDLPLFVHERESEGEVLRILKDADDLPPVVIHCFTGTRSELTEYLNAGFYIGITGWIADTRRGDTLRDIVSLIPPDRLLIETDAPYLRPHNAPGDVGASPKRNEPALLPYVLSALAEAREETAEELATATSENARHLFGFS